MKPAKAAATETSNTSMVGIVLCAVAQKKAPPQRCLGIEHLGGVSRDVSPRTLGLGVNAQTSDANVSPE
jgi:hypothetical protein